VRSDFATEFVAEPRRGKKSAAAQTNERLVQLGYRRFEGDTERCNRMGLHVKNLLLPLGHSSFSDSVDSCICRLTGGSRCYGDLLKMFAVAKLAGEECLHDFLSGAVGTAAKILLRKGRLVAGIQELDVEELTFRNVDLDGAVFTGLGWCCCNGRKSCHLIYSNGCG
jgi:hypothetical protein